MSHQKLLILGAATRLTQSDSHQSVSTRNKITPFWASQKCARTKQGPFPRHSALADLSQQVKARGSMETCLERGGSLQQKDPGTQVVMEDGPMTCPCDMSMNYSLVLPRGKRAASNPGR